MDKSHYKSQAYLIPLRNGIQLQLGYLGGRNSMKKSVEVAFKKEFEGWQDISSSEKHQCWVLERQLQSWIWQKGH